MSARIPAAAGAALALAAGLAGCGSGGEVSSQSTAVAVAATDTTCELSATTVPAGTVEFTVANSGTKTTEFYLYGQNGQDVVAEVEDIGPGLSRVLSADLPGGSYVTACKPGMEGEGIRGTLTVELNR